MVFDVIHFKHLFTLQGEGADNFNTGMQWNTSGSSDDVTNEVSFIEEQPDECDLTSVRIFTYCATKYFFLIPFCNRMYVITL